MESKIQITNSGIDLLNALKAKEGSVNSIQMHILSNVYDSPLTSNEILGKCLKSGVRINPGIILSVVDSMLRQGLISNISSASQIIDIVRPVVSVEKPPQKKELDLSKIYIKKESPRKKHDVKEVNVIEDEEDELKYATRYDPVGQYIGYYCDRCGIEVDDPYRCPNCGGKVSEEIRSTITEEDIGGKRL